MSRLTEKPPGFIDMASATTDELLRDIKNLITEHCVEIEELCLSYGLEMTQITVIARNPDESEMYSITTNESDLGLLAVCDLIQKIPAKVAT